MGGTRARWVDTDMLRRFMVFEMLRAGEKQSVIAAVTGMSQQRISDIKRQCRDEIFESRDILPTAQ